MEKIGVLLVDDHPIVSEGLEFMLNLDPELLVLGTASDALKGLKIMEQLHPDVVVLDLSMPKMDGLEAINLYRESSSHTKIVVFSAHAEEKFVYRAFDAGAQGYVVKGAPLSELKQAIKFVKNGSYWVSSQFSKSIIEKYLKALKMEKPEQSAYDLLTSREKQVFRLMVEGKQTEEIGNLLFISSNTVAKHRRTLMQKLGFDNVVEMTKFAIRNGIIDI